MTKDNLKLISARDITFIALSVALMAICSWISVPMTVPVTLQTFAVFTAAGLLGMKRGTAAVLIYILLGAIGLPVFAGFTGGFGILAGSTGGYIIGFAFSALVVGSITKPSGRKQLCLLFQWLQAYWYAMPSGQHGSYMYIR